MVVGLILFTILHLGRSDSEEEGEEDFCPATDDTCTGSEEAKKHENFQLTRPKDYGEVHQTKTRKTLLLLSEIPFKNKPDID